MRRRLLLLLLLLVTPLSVPAQQATRTPWRLSGTIVAGRSAWAVVENSSGMEREVHIRDRLDGCRVSAITTTGLGLDCADGQRWHSLERDPEAASVTTSVVGTAPAEATDTAELPAQAFRDLISDRQRLVSEISLKPRVRDGQVEGYEVENLKSGSLLEGHGLNIGDVIVAVNGSFASQAQNFMDTIRQLASAPDFLLQVERDGVTRQLLVQLR